MTSKIHKKLNAIIMDYCFGKLFSVLKIGACIENDLGFDLIIYKWTVEFQM